MSRRLVVEADGGSRGNPGPAAYGAIVRDPESGEVLAQRAERIGTATNNVAEYRGLIAGLSAAREIDPAAGIDVRLDSKLIVEQMSGRWAIKNSAIRGLALAARDLIADDTTFTWVPREQNRAADALVNAALDGRPLPAASAGPARVRRPAIPGWGPDLGAPTTTMFVRHGATDHTARRVFSGSDGEDPPLSEAGLAQAAAVAAELRRRGGASAIVTSPMARTRATAAAIAAELGVEPVLRPALRECEFGEWNGLTFDEVFARWPVELDHWLRDPNFAPPGGESLSAVHARVDVALDQIRQEHEGTAVVVVSHVNPIRCAVGLVLEVALAALPRLEVPPTSITTLRWWQDGNAAVGGFADVGHLGASGH